MKYLSFTSNARNWQKFVIKFVFFFSEGLGLTYFVENAFILEDRNDEISIWLFFSSKNLNQYI